LFCINFMDEKQEKIKKVFDWRGFWVRLWELLAPSHRQMIWTVVLIFFLELINLASPYFLKLIIDNLTSFGIEKIKEVLELVIVMFFVNEVSNVLNYWTDRKIVTFLVNQENYLPSQAHQKMMSMDLPYHERENTGQKILKIQRGVFRIHNLVENLFWEVIPTLIQIVFTAIILFVVDWRFGLVLVLFIPVFVVMTLKVNKDVRPMREDRFKKDEVASELMTQSVININTVKSFVQEKWELSKFKKLADKITEIVNFEFRKISKYNFLRTLVIDIGRVLILGFGVFLVWKSYITLGSLVFVFTISEKALFSLFRITRLYDRIMESAEAIDRFYDLFQQEPTVKNPSKGLKPEVIQGQIEFQNVSFIYEESRMKALNGVNMKINSGCVTALVGPSGGGKTTVARMIFRHYDPQEGKVLLDDKDLKEYDIYSFRKFFSIVPQEVEIFNMSVKENIAYANPQASFQQIEAAARIANAEEFIKQLKEGYNTLVGERGIKLSGGQRQRIGIARAILANPRVLIFDEATSSLDSYSEKLIQEAIDKIRKGRTVIIIAHRLSTIKKADKIIVLEKGRVVEEGSHLELAHDQGGLYKKLLDLQKMGDVD